MEKKTKRNWNENNLKKIKYQSHKRRNYCIKTLDKESAELYILGYNYSKTEGFTPNAGYVYNKVKDSTENIGKAIDEFCKQNYISDSEKLIHKGGSVFDSLISLRQNLDFPYDIDEYSTNKTLCELEKSISDKDKKTIIKWLKIYGMPFLGNPINDTIGKAYIGNVPFCYGFTNDITTCVTKEACICRLGSFLVALNTIYTTFYLSLIYLHKINKDNKIDIEILKNTIEEGEKPVQMTYKEREELEKKIDKYDLDGIKSYMKSAFLSISIKNVFNVDIMLDINKLPKPEVYAETLISLAMYQLMIIFSSGRIYTASRCNNCNNLYIPTRKSNKYCVDCSRQKRWNKNNIPK